MASLLIEDGDLLVKQIGDGLVAALVPSKRIVPAFDGGTALDILRRGNIGNALLGHMPSSCGGEAEVVESLEQFAREGRNIVFYVNQIVAQELEAILADTGIRDKYPNKYRILNKLGGIDPRCLVAEIRGMFPEIFRLDTRRFSAYLDLIAKKALAQSVRLRVGAAAARRPEFPRANKRAASAFF